MAWTAPRTYTTGEVITAAILNVHVRDNLLETSPAKVTTAGDLLVATGANTLKRLALGTAAQALSVNAVGTDVEWADVATQAELDAHTGAAAPHSGHETPAGAQAKVDTHNAVTNPHSATTSATGSRLILRDSAGRAKVTAPSAVDDIAVKGTVDTVQAALTAHIAAATIDHPDGSVNDTKLGNRTADPTIATAYALAGTLTQHLSWLTKNIKALKGVAGNWYDAASATIEGLWAKFDATTGHAHTAAAGDGPVVSFVNLSNAPETLRKTLKFNQVRWVLPGWTIFTLTASALSDGVVYYTPIYVAETTTYIGIGVHVTSSAASSTVELAIYEWNNGLPGDLILNAGTVVGTSTGEKEITISQQLLGGKYYFLASRSSGGSPSLRTFDAQAAPITGHRDIIDGATTLIPFVTGTMTDPATAPTGMGVSVAVRLREN